MRKMVRKWRENEKINRERKWRGNGERMRKWTERENGDREMKWRERGEMETMHSGRGWLSFRDDIFHWYPPKKLNLI